MNTDGGTPPKRARKSHKRQRRRKGTGTVIIKTDEHGRFVSAAYRLPIPGQEKPEEEFGFASPELAEAALDKRVEDLQNIRTGVPHLQPVRQHLVPVLQDLLQLYVNRLKGRGGYSTANSRRKHLSHVLGHVPVNELTPSHVVMVVDYMEEQEYAPAYIGGTIRILRSVGNTEAFRQYQRINPASNTELSEQTKARIKSDYDFRKTPYIRLWEKDNDAANDVKRMFYALRDLVDESIAVAYWIGVHTGCRTAELLALHCEDFTLTPGLKRIHLWRQVINGSLLERLKDSTANDRSRYVPVTSSLERVVAPYIEKLGGKGPLFRPRVEGRGGRPDLGQPAQFLGAKTLNNSLAKILERLDIQPSEREKIGWYEATKHTFATHFMLRGGEKDDLVMWLGHSNEWVTKRYSHVDSRNYPFKGLDLFDDVVKASAHKKPVPFGRRKNEAKKKARSKHMEKTEEPV